MGPSAGRGLAYRQPDKVREVAGYGLPGHTNARRDSHDLQSQEAAKDPLLLVSVVHGRFPGSHTDLLGLDGLVSRQSKAELRICVKEVRSGEK